MQTSPPFAFEAQPSPEQIRAAVDLVQRRRLWFVRGFGALVLLFGVVLAVTEESDPSNRALVIAIFVVLGAVAGLGLPWLARRKAISATTQLVGVPCSYRIDADGVRSATEHSEGLVRWPLITAIDEVAGLVLVRLGKVRYLPVPVDGLDPATREALLGFLREHAGRGPEVVPGEDDAHA